MWPKSIHFVENLREVLFKLSFDADLLLKQVQVIHLTPSLGVHNLVDHQWISLFHIRNENLMDLSAKFLLRFTANWVDYIS